MKKVILIIFAVLTGILFTDAFRQNSIKERSSYRQPIMLLSQQENPLWGYTFEITKEEYGSRFVKNLVSVLRENQASASSTYQSEDGSTFLSYICTPENRLPFALRNGQTPLSTDLTDGYLTSDPEDTGAAGILDFADRNNCSPGKWVYQISSMENETFLEEMLKGKQVHFLVDAPDQKELARQFEKLPFRLISSGPMSTGSVNESALANTAWLLAGVFVLFMAWYVLSSYRTIRILSSNGLYAREIFCRLFLKLFLQLEVLMTVEMAVLFVCFAGWPRPINQTLLHSCVQAVLALSLLVVLMMLAGYGMVYLASKVSLKTRTVMAGRFTPVLLLFQTVLVVCMVPGFAESLNASFTSAQYLVSLRENQDFIQSWITQTGIPTLQNSSQRDSLDAFLEENKAICQRQLFSHGMDEKTGETYSSVRSLRIPDTTPAVRVNASYLLLEGVREQLGDLPEEGIQPRTVLIPDTLEERIQGTPDSGWEIRTYPAGGQFPLLGIPLGQAVLENPVIEVLPNWLPGQHSPVSGANIYFLSESEWTVQALNQEMEQLGVEIDWETQNANVAARLDLISGELGTEVLTALFYLFLFLVLIFCCLEMYLTDQGQRLALRAAAGCSPFDELKKTAAGLCLSYGIVLAVLMLQIQNQEAMPFMLEKSMQPAEAALIVLMALIIETACFAVLYRRWSEKKLMTLLRNEL